ncbi:hypothetical protein BJP36_34315 [Moorena producens JHB]|uniref:Uncharacterized protein n=1 Tax=Moorena producens (strain JHB) TaxID=1454205 RepID=A0A1D9G9C0_MOOP1|nr:hypothetical protein [Moorena producens]AOY84249.1 hypothetical protein BJP36_34315 [Moorena producens JHB]
MQIGDLENLQEINIDKLSSVEGGMIAIVDKPIADQIHVGDLRINPDYKRPIYPYCPPPPPPPCYPYPRPLPYKDIKAIPLRICPVIL